MKVSSIKFSLKLCGTSMVNVLLFTIALKIQAQPVKPYQPARQQVLRAYKAAALLDSLAKKSVFKSYVNANWQTDEKGFWYRNLLAGDSAEYLYVNALTATRQNAFDHAKMAMALNKVLDTTVTAGSLPISNMQFDGLHQHVAVEVQKKWYRCNLKTYSCSKTDSVAIKKDNGFITGNIKSRWERQPASDSLSPDKQWAAYQKNGNLFIQSVKDGQTEQVTQNGDTAKPYGQIQWSPDSKHLVVFHINPVKEKPVYYILSSIDTLTRGVLKRNDYAQPGDAFSSYEMFIINMDDKKLLKVNTELYDFLDYPWIHWRTGDNRYFVLEKADRGHQRFRMIEVDAANGNTRNLIDEKTNTFIYESRIFTWYTAATNEIIWSSEKDGWNQLYLVDAIKGGVKNRITNGNWVVRNIDSVDEKKREIWFQASGVNQGEDPYNIHYYRIGFDGKNLVSLTLANASHLLSFSPNRKYFIDNYSRPDMPAVTELHRTADGKLICVLEKADIGKYQQLGLKMPEVFVAKGRDHATDIWGVVCRPSHFDSTLKYPVIENIYAGPQDAFVPKRFMNYSEMQSMAELGFIVVQCDGMGTANRSKAFHDVCWKNLADAGFADRILWIKGLAAKYTYVDVARVGLYGTSAGGQNAAGAVLFHPEFYKAAVSAAGCHDNRIDKQWWNEQWMGYPVGPHYAAQSNVTNAGKLKGALLLIVGEADTNVPPESTYRMANALIKAGKNFDLLVVPGMGHSDGGPYGRQKKRDFFVKHLLGVDPPDRNMEELNAGNP
ncbi:MAG: family peptidase [Ferruginibacter sp.]|uniref:S9 family peptidase n=1 Tax=Ferruginibacter sp. TaxID=1940288 RepID=UPI002658C3AB|nr:S9 family peptidase [Ferruginibacter sp.]MDB5279422.1 family peptidase [Ferruginibacter sp.]